MGCDATGFRSFREIRHQFPLPLSHHTDGRIRGTDHGWRRRNCRDTLVDCDERPATASRQKCDSQQGVGIFLDECTVVEFWMHLEMGRSHVRIHSACARPFAINALIAQTLRVISNIGSDRTTAVGNSAKTERIFRMTMTARSRVEVNAVRIRPGRNVSRVSFPVKSTLKRAG